MDGLFFEKASTILFLPFRRGTGLWIVGKCPLCTELEHALNIVVKDVLAVSINRFQRLQVVNRHSTVSKRHDAQDQGCLGEFIKYRIIIQCRTKSSKFLTHPIEIVINLLFCERLQGDRALKIKTGFQGFILLAATTDHKRCQSMLTAKVIDRTDARLAVLRQNFVQPIEQESRSSFSIQSLAIFFGV